MRKELLDISKVIAKNSFSLARRSKIRQAGVGYKITDGKITDTVGIVFFVKNKPSPEVLRDQQIEPVEKEIEGIPTDVVEIPGGFKPRITPDDARHRPFAGGVAMINYREPATGTLGIVVKRNRGIPTKLYGVTNNHVGANEDVKGLRPPAAQKGDYWTQPGAHGGGTVPDDVIARLYKWNRLLPSAPGNMNYYDCAIGQITSASHADAQPYQVMEIGPVKGLKDLDLSNKVMKRGRTTLKTIGKVVALMASTQIEYSGYPCDFADQLIIAGDPVSTPFSQPGDSGSLVVSADKDPATGAYPAGALLFAGGPSSDNIDLTIASPFGRIELDFGLEL